MRVEGSFTVAAPPERVFAEITNPGLMASCVPGRITFDGKGHALLNDSRVKLAYLRL